MQKGIIIVIDLVTSPFFCMGTLSGDSDDQNQTTRRVLCSDLILPTW